MKESRKPQGKLHNKIYSSEKKKFGKTTIEKSLNSKARYNSNIRLTKIYDTKEKKRWIYETIYAASTSLGSPECENHAIFWKGKFWKELKKEERLQCRHDQTFCFPFLSRSSSASASFSCSLRVAIFLSKSSTVPLLVLGWYGATKWSEKDLRASTPVTYKFCNNHS